MQQQNSGKKKIQLNLCEMKQKKKTRRAMMLLFAAHIIICNSLLM